MNDPASEISPPFGPEHATERDAACMRRALELAERAGDAGDTPVGAVVYRTGDGAVLAEAHNRREIDQDPTAHAELLALRAAAERLGSWRLDGCTLVVTLEPCVMCAGAIVNARIGRLVYAASDPKGGGVESLHRLCQDPRLNHRVRPIAGLLEREASGMLTRFFRARRG